MKVTPALKEEISNWLDTYWTTYLKGDIATWATFIRDDYRNIGGTKEEIWNSKQEIIDYTNSVMDQMLGTVEIRNREIDLIPYGEYIMVNEFTDLYIKVEGEWNFYGPFRMSSLLEKTDTGWIALHQHGSYPDMRAMEGEAFSIDALKAENAKLQAAVKSRTHELEQNNRELEIEAATERVRVQSMAMQQPGDLEKVNKELLHQLNKLKIPGLAGVSFYFVDPDEIVTVWDLSSPGNMNDPNSYSFRFDSKKNPVLGEFVGILKSKQDDYFILDFPKDRLLQAIEELKDIDFKIYNNFKHAVETGALQHQWNPAARITDGILSIDLMMPPTEDTKVVVLKMAGAFNQAYTRFLDLQKAAAQTREAQIEAALERVRSRTMAMQHSSELSETSALLFQQIQTLGVPPWSCGFNIWEQGDAVFTSYMGSPDGAILDGFKIPLTEDASFIHFQESRDRGDKLFIDVLEGETLEEHYRYFFTLPGIKEAFEKRAQDGEQRPTFQINHLANFSHGNLMFITYEPCPEAHDVFIRFAKVFEQTYTRFLDLQKAEALAREAQIEAGLERVRSRSLAMHHTSELQEVINRVHKELLHLDVAILGGSFIAINSDIDATLRCWGSGGTADTSEEIHLPLYDKPFCSNLINRIKNGPGFFTEAYTQQEKQDFFTFLFRHEPWSKLDPEQKKETLYSTGGYTRSCCVSRHTSIFIINHLGEPFTAADNDILQRFAKVFEQTYTRFLDLQKAESQTREAQIETSLERIRAASLAMRDSAALGGIIYKLYGELTKLDAQLDRCFIMIVNPENKGITWWMAGQEGLLAENGFFVQNNQHASHLWYLDCWKKRRKKWQYLLEGKEKRDWDRFGFSKTELARLPEFIKKFMAGVNKINLTGSSDQFGSLVTGSFEPLPDEQQDIISRFTIAFNQAYIRFLDLQKAEAQAREAQIETALERVRSRSMAMHTSQELNEVSLELRKQMGLLGQKDLEVCAIHLYDDEDTFESWSAMKAPESDVEIIQTQARFSKKGIRIVDELLQHYVNGTKDYVLVNEGEKMTEWFAALQKHAPELHASIMHSIGELPLVKLKANWSVADFSGGALVMVTYGEPGIQSRNLLRRSANVFEQAYIRFLDLQKAEAQALRAEQDLIEIKVARKKAEEALSELQQTQKQLIQSEKMASLGELTAGIAHEIQNPLNFVNNFSEVSNELISEMVDEVDKGNTEEVKAIAKDVQQNLEKILHHGKRADAIVKGMLQHSNSGSGKKEPTDINKLADEYLRLAYHGLRAKDKFFNATMLTDYDETLSADEAGIGNINIIPQDIGRVILNLITNAFYAASPPAPQGGILDPAKNNIPTVWVSTKNVGDKVEIRVRDNGPGIPQKILDKIFQPFFTTKPTGQGTGLGLSLSYDIVKAHGGEIKVNTKENEGTEFIIELPVNN